MLYFKDAGEQWGWKEGKEGVNYEAILERTEGSQSNRSVSWFSCILVSPLKSVEVFSSLLSLCCRGSCSIARTKWMSCLMSCFSQNTCSPVSCPVRCAAALMVAGPSCQPWEMSLCLQGAQEQSQRLHSGDRLCAQDKLSQVMCDSSEAS